MNNKTRWTTSALSLLIAVALCIGGIVTGELFLADATEDKRPVVIIDAGHPEFT